MEMQLTYYNRAVEFLEVSPPIDSEVVRKTLEKRFPRLEVHARERFRLADKYLSVLRAERKKTTIRYAKNAIEYPASDCLPIFSEDGLGSSQYVGTYNIVGMQYKSFGDLDDEDAIADGFASCLDLKSDLRRFYGSIADNEIVSIFIFTKAADVATSPEGFLASR